MSQTKLEAVNSLLRSIGESRVNSLSSGLSDAAEALEILEEVSREVQADGWSCNREDNYTILPDENGYIQLPASILKADPSDPSLKYYRKGRRLYNGKDQTFVFTDPVKLDVVFHLTWEELDFPLQNYIVKLAAQRYQAESVGSVAMDRFTSRPVAEAWEKLLHHEAEVEDSNVLDNPHNAPVVYRNRRTLRAY